MRKLILSFAWFCAMAFIAAHPAQAASNTFSYVSNSGDNSNTCDAPATACSSFAGALSKTNNYGEIDCVNAGRYEFLDVVTITQSVTIDCAGGVGAATAAVSEGPGNGTIVVNGPGIVVRLRNLSFNRNGFGVGGIDVLNAAALYVENCVITNANGAIGVNELPNIGIRFEPSANAQLFVGNSIISNNGAGDSSLSGGISIVPASGIAAKVVIDHSHINGNYFGIVGDGRSGGTIHAKISDSVVSGNTENGITALSSGSSVVFIIDQTKVTGNLAGLFVSGSNAGMLVSNSTVFNNTIGLEAASGGTLFTYGNNRVNGNTTNGAFTGMVGLQ